MNEEQLSRAEYDLAEARKKLAALTAELEALEGKR